MEGKHTDAANVSFILFARIYREENGRVERKYSCGIVAKLFKNKCILTFYKRSSKSRDIHTKNAN